MHEKFSRWILLIISLVILTGCYESTTFYIEFDGSKSYEGFIYATGIYTNDQIYTNERYCKPSCDKENPHLGLPQSIKLTLYAEKRLELFEWIRKTHSNVQNGQCPEYLNKNALKFIKENYEAGYDDYYNVSFETIKEYPEIFEIASSRTSCEVIEHLGPDSWNQNYAHRIIWTRLYLEYKQNFHENHLIQTKNIQFPDSFGYGQIKIDFVTESVEWKD